MSYFLFIHFFISMIYFCIMLYFIWHWHRIAIFKPEKNERINTFISIIIPARNEENVICNLLSDIVKQKYPGNLFEIIIVDDYSADKTYDVVENFISSHPQFNLKVVKNKLSVAGSLYKKSAITMAVNMAIGSLIITTDADCRVGEYWLLSFASYYEKTKAKFISGPVKLTEENSLLEKLQLMEFSGLIGVGAASIRAGIPIMCNGANIAYERKAFLDSGGYLMDKNASGDDVFLMFKLSKKFPGELHFIKCTEAIVSTVAQKNIITFFHQRKRWASKVTNYKSFYTLFIAAFVFLVNFSLLAGMCLSFFYPSYIKFLLLYFLFKLCVDFIFVYSIEGFFNRKKLLYLFLPAEILNVFYVSIIASVAPFGKYLWKGRKLR